MTKKKNQPVIGNLEPIYQVWGWVLLGWSLYRYFFKLPEWADELVFKPLIFLGPVFWYVFKKEKQKWASLGVSSKNLFTSIYIGLGFGLLFALEGLVLNITKHGQLTVNPIESYQEYGLMLLLILSIATAFSEELLNRGFLFNRILSKSKNLFYALGIATLLFVLLHVPVLVTTLKLQGITLVIFFITNAMLGLLNSLLIFNTGSIIAPILVHAFWNMTVAMFF